MYMAYFITSNRAHHNHIVCWMTSVASIPVSHGPPHFQKIRPESQYGDKSW